MLNTKMEVDSDKKMKSKTMKKKWEKVAEIMNKHSYTFNSTQVSNRYKTLERGYKRIHDYKTKPKTGRGKKRPNVSAKVLE